MAASPLGQDYSVDEFIKERLKSCHVTSKGMITGYLDTKEAYIELMRDLQVLGCRFSVRSTYSAKSSDPANLQYKTLTPDLQIPFTGTPFHVECTTYFLCTHGYKYFKSKCSIEDGDKAGKGSLFKRKPRRVSESIKIGCPAKMTVKSISVYPDYKTAADSWRRKFDVLKRLKADLKSSPPPRCEAHFWIAVSPESAHTHERTATLRIQPLHADVTSEIHRLVGKGITSVPQIKSHLLSFVENMFKNAKLKPDPSNTAFYPAEKNIYNHIYEIKNLLATRLLTKSTDGCDAPNPDSSTTTANSATSDVASTPRQEHQIPERCDPDLAVVPVLESFGTDWEGQSVLPTNLVQVINNNGTLMLMVTQPLGNQAIERVESPTLEPPSNVVNVNLDENIYTVITDPSQQRILQINNASNILMSQHCTDPNGIREVLTMQDSDSTLALQPDKNNEMGLDHVMSVESSVIMGVRNTSNTGCLDDDRDDVSCHDESNEFLFVEEDSQTELLMKEVKNQTKELTELCVTVSTESIKDSEPSLFTSALVSDDSDNNLDRTCVVSVNKENFKNSKSRKRMRRNSEVDVESLQQEDGSFLLCKSLKDCAQDIVNMSYASTNTSLLRQMAKVFEKYRKLLRDDIEGKRKLIIDDELSSVSSEKSRWKATSSFSEFSERISFQSHQNKVPSSPKHKPSGRNLFSTSESSVDDYDELIISD